MSQGQKVSDEIKLIRSALVKQGDRLQKLPRQAVWLIHHHDGKSYRMTYQPAPLSTWAIHPPDSEASYLLGVIDRALNSPPSNIDAGVQAVHSKTEALLEHKQNRSAIQPCSPSTHDVKAPTAYNQQLHPWCIIQNLPQMQRRVVARFRRRNDADAHLRVLRQQAQLQYTIVFDPNPAQTCVAAEERPDLKS